MAAATVTTTVLRNDRDFYAVHLTCVITDTGETNVIKVDKSSLIGPDGTEPTALDLVSARWCLQGFSLVTLSWDHTADKTLMFLSGSGYDDFGGFTKRDNGTGETGDVLLTTTGTTSGSTYDITLIFAKRD